MLLPERRNLIPYTADQRREMMEKGTFTYNGINYSKSDKVVGILEFAYNNGVTEYRGFEGRILEIRMSDKLDPQIKLKVEDYLLHVTYIFDYRALVQLHKGGQQL